MIGRTGRIAAIGFAAILLGISTGCSQQSTGETATHLQAANRIDSIAQKSGGDWNKLSPDDKAFLLKLSYGSESSARMILAGRSGNLHGPATPEVPAVRPAGGPPS